MVAIHLDTPTAPVTMHCCSACDRREWSVDGVSADRDTAMSQIATTARR